MQIRNLSIIFFLLLVNSFLIGAPVDDFLTPEPTSERKTKKSGENSTAPEKREIPKEEETKPSPAIHSKKEKEESVASQSSSTSSHKSKRVQRRKKSKTASKKVSPTEKGKEEKVALPKKYENTVPGVSDLPPKTSYDSKSSGAESPGHGKGIPVLCYHHLVGNGDPMGGYNLDPNLLEEQFKFLQGLGYQTVSLDQFYAYIQGKAGNDFPKRPILLTFDDGSITHRNVLVPLLKKYGFRASVFIYPTVISNPKYKYYLSWAELKDALDSGVLDIGSHTVYHPKLPAMKRAEIRQQLRDSKATLEAKTGRKIQDLAYPFGLFDVRVIEEAKAAGYRMAFTVNRGKNIPGTDPYTVHRALIAWGISQKTFNAILTTAPPSKIRLGIADGSWVNPGETFNVGVEGLEPSSITMQIGGKDRIVSRKSDTEYTVRIPDFHKTTSYPTMVIRGKSKAGITSETQFLFVNRREFKRDPD
ncbi:polysaccharide deacetylase family protein [Leptospira wolffii]|uniref:polysaccharide deacetylase family protein n=1 Tax=Leptospira wolffii TaxID=409998 RepID=UPI0003053EB2|nr:polysaccharide deacetylase family protein [Leptospira wolffii]EPG66013.1 polysaccharide deacetylase [Leptospira wolffii serovar Khorat str. Khorat-H2]